MTTKPAEKVLAVAAIYASLIEELHLLPPVPLAEPTPGLHLTTSKAPTIEFVIPPVVMAALISAATEIALHTSTRDMGLMARVEAGLPVPRSPLAVDFARQDGEDVVGSLPEGYDENDPYARD